MIGPNCDLKAKKGMVFNVNVGVSGLQNKVEYDSSIFSTGAVLYVQVQLIHISLYSSFCHCTL